MPADSWSMWERGGEMAGMVAGTAVPKAFLPAIGYVIVVFSRLDAELDFAISDFLRSGYRNGRAVVATIPNYRPRIDLFERLVDFNVADKADRRKLHTLASAIRKCADERHRLIHDYVSHYSNLGQEVAFARKEILDQQAPKKTMFTKPSLKTLGSQMADLAFRLQRFRKNDPAWKADGRFPWQDKPPSRSR